MLEGLIVGDTDCAGIRGSSIIPHHLRRGLGLSIEEYAVMSYLDSLLKENSKVAAVDEKDLWKQLGMRIREFTSVQVVLEVKGFVIALPAGKLLIEEKWLENFNHDEQFNQLYVLFQKKGNKVRARECFNKVIKMIPFSQLFAHGKAYQNNVKDREITYRKGLDVWLNPKTRCWEDAESEIVAVKAETIKLGRR